MSFPAYPINQTYQLCVSSGLMTGIAVWNGTTNGQVAAFRWTSTTKSCLVHRVAMTWRTTTGFTAAQEVGFGMWIIRGYTAPHSGIGTSGAISKRWGAAAATVAGGINISDTAQLTAGTFTLPTANDCILQGWCAELATGAAVPKNGFSVERCFNRDSGVPVRLEANEGLMVQNLIAMGAGGVGRLVVEIEYSEVSSTL
jgi:hypothetical protein